MANNVIKCQDNKKITIVDDFYLVTSIPTSGQSYIQGFSLQSYNIWGVTFYNSTDDTGTNIFNILDYAIDNYDIVIGEDIAATSLLNKIGEQNYTLLFQPKDGARFFTLEYKINAPLEYAAFSATSYIGTTNLGASTGGFMVSGEIRNSPCYYVLFALPIKTSVGAEYSHGYVIFNGPVGQSRPNQWYVSSLTTRLEIYSTVIDGLYNNEIYISRGDIDNDDYGNYSDTSGYGQEIDPATGKARKGSFDNTSDTIAIADNPKIQVSDAGFVNIYHVSKNQLVNLGAEIFPSMTTPSLPESGSTLTDVCNAIISMIGNFFTFFSESIFNSRLIDYIIDCHVIPCAPTDSVSDFIQLGGRKLSYAAPKVANDYITVDCGSLSIAEYYANFLDYYTTCKLYLPFVGFVDLKNEFFQSGTISVTYKFNVIDGSFCCYVKATSSKSQLSDSVIAQYSGAACLHIPITGTNYAAMISGVANGVMQAVSGAASANVGTVLDGAMNALAASPSMQQSNGYNSTGAFMGIRYPYLVIERVVPSFSASYTHENGLPLNVSKKLSEVSGFTVCESVDISGINGASDAELEEIKALLSSGVYL